MKRNPVSTAASLFLSALLVGCGDDDSKSNEQVNNGGGFFPGMSTGLQDAAGGPPPGNPQPGIQPGGAPINPAAENQGFSIGPLEATQDNTGRKGRAYGGGIITQPISSYFRIQDRLNLDIIKHSLQLYDVSNDGKPKSHEEFVEQILAPANLKLPEAADPNYDVRYSPETGWLILVPKDGSQ